MKKLNPIFYMNKNKMIKIFYHLFAAIILLYLAQKQTTKYLTYSLLFISLFHFYDTIWFFNNEGNAPI